MNCKLKSLLAFLLFCAVAYLAVKYVPPAWGGYGALVILVILAVVGLLGWLISVIRHVRNPYEGAQYLRRQARKVAKDESIDINTAAQEIWDQAQEQGRTFPKREMDTMPRPVMVDRAHIQHIRANEAHETMPFAGYDRAPAKELPAGNEVQGIQVDASEKQPVWRHDG